LQPSPDSGRLLHGQLLSSLASSACHCGTDGHREAGGVASATGAANRSVWVPV